MSKEALEKSIKHWEKNLEKVINKELLNLSSKNCALCLEYLENNCEKCPIKHKTNMPFCYHTPYYDVLYFCQDILNNVDFDSNWDNLEKAVVEEIQFLKSLK